MPMTEEQLAAKKKNAGEKKVSMKRRDDHHDYKDRRMYLITLEVEGRLPVFGRLAGDAFAEKGSKDEPRIVLSELGKAVENEWFAIPRHFPQIEIRALQMMPDHLHGILFVKTPLPVHLGHVISGFKAGCRRALREMAKPLTTVAAKPQPTEKPSTLACQHVTSPQAALPSQSIGRLSPSLFAKGYNDLILHSYDELPIWQNYLRDNPRRLLMKRARPEWLRPVFDLHIGSYRFSAIGNRDLLSSPWRIAVRVSRRMSDIEISKTVNYYLEAARKGAVLVSPAISPGEKQVMRAAFNEGLPTIVIVENGFTSLSKPHGEQFHACGRGVLLMLSPFEHLNEKRKVTAEQCRLMNLMALEICR